MVILHLPQITTKSTNIRCCTLSIVDDDDKIGSVILECIMHVRHYAKGQGKQRHQKCVCVTNSKQNTGMSLPSSASVVFECSDLLAHVMAFLPLSELAHLPTVSKPFSQASRKRIGQISQWRFQATCFGENPNTWRLPIPELLLQHANSSSEQEEDEEEEEEPAKMPFTLQIATRAMYKLTRLDLVTCRIAEQDLLLALEHVRHTLQDLRIEMMHITEQSTGETGSLEMVEMTNLRRFDLSPSSHKVFYRLNMPNLQRLGSHKKRLLDKCSCCARSRPSSKCGQCRFYAFCSRDCQVENWSGSTAGHKQVCCAQDSESISTLLLQGMTSQLLELDLAHYWQPNLLFEAPVEADGEPVPTLSPVFTAQMAPRYFANMQSLRLVRCGVRDDDVYVIAQHAPQIQCLDLSLNTKISDVALQDIAKYWSKTMRDLRLRQTYRVTDSGIREHVTKLFQAEYLDLRVGLKRSRPTTREPNTVNIRVVSVTSQLTVSALADALRAKLQMLKLLVEQNHAVQVPLGMEHKFELDWESGSACDFQESWGEVFED